MSEGLKVALGAYVRDMVQLDEALVRERAAGIRLQVALVRIKEALREVVLHPSSVVGPEVEQALQGAYQLALDALDDHPAKEGAADARTHP